ncbi:MULTISPECIES: hypothetical protein [Cyanophyceae]|uniref:GapS4a family protein n=1 Tax=Cyanophyceae TaxID=3028117 RepID=UPI0016882385|nr:MULTISPECIES: hypothetical protein [Cyanophyceae]MBD1916870.1 hypothetical protein [Phormidium sp. FACHB-77]MBD2028881.1 hypothetical protein [Phormidium sp. FACHB-322]MBD2051566.1 hypothetical protein [Leptolyngbya sp. FACHB-60]
MGEWSRRIGEVGEEIVGEFLDLIGWGNSQQGLTLPCMMGPRHGTASASRHTHGIDYFFSYASELSNRTLHHLVISVKYSDDPYPGNPSSKFKEHFYDLAKAIECFRRSEIKRLASREFYGVDDSKDIGVLFWLTNSQSNENASDSILLRVDASRSLEKFNYGTIYLVENSRVSFIYDVMKYLAREQPTADLEFFYPQTGKNYNSIDSISSGKVLPVEFINSRVLPLKLSNKKYESKTFVLATIDEFDVDCLKRLMGLAHTLSSNLASNVMILFPDFDRLHHENDVRSAKSSFRDNDFVSDVRVSSYRANFRNLSNE